MFFYTICTLSHLYQAEVLVKTLLSQHPDAIIKVGLVDKLTPDIDLTPLAGAEVVEVEKLNIAEFPDMIKRYSIFELCFACKPFYALYFFEQFPRVDKLIYVDTDIYAFGSFDDIQRKLDEYALIITPHITEDLDDGHKMERLAILAGLFNAGFFAVSRKKEGFDFLHWFADKLKTECIGRVGDQVWLNLAPIFFEKVLIEKSNGYNMAGWNVKKRFASLEEGRIVINGDPLVFYHYSGLDYMDLTRVSKFTSQGAEVKDRPDLLRIVQPVAEKLAASAYHQLKNRKSAYFNIAPNKRGSQSDTIMKRTLRKLFNRLGFDIVRS